MNCISFLTRIIDKILGAVTFASLIFIYRYIYTLIIIIKSFECFLIINHYPILIFHLIQCQICIITFFIIKFYLITFLHLGRGRVTSYPAVKWVYQALNMYDYFPENLTIDFFFKSEIFFHWRHFVIITGDKEKRMNLVISRLNFEIFLNIN